MEGRWSQGWHKEEGIRMQMLEIIGFLKEQNNNINHKLGKRVNRGNRKG